MNKLSHRFVELMPEVLEEGVLYVSIAYGTIAHRCCCGCRREVVTPLTPTDWKLIFDGETVSLYPSIGNWNFPCRSHYWIRHNRVEWAEDWSKWQIAAAGRAVPVQVNRAVSLHALKSRLIDLLASAKPTEAVLAELTEWFLHNPTRVRPGRKVERRKFSPSRSYHYQRRVRKLVF